MRKDDYQPWDIYESTDREWKERREKKNASHKDGNKSNEQNAQDVQEQRGSEESEVGILCQQQQKEGGIEQVAPVEKRRPGRPKKVDQVLQKIVG